MKLKGRISRFGPVSQITQIAADSDIADFEWTDRGVAPAGYINGMSAVYARVCCKLKTREPTQSKWPRQTPRTPHATRWPSMTRYLPRMG